MKAFKKYAERLKRDDLESVERRKLWQAMVGRIETVFAEIKDSPLAHHFGSLFLHPVIPEPLQKLREDQLLGQLQLSCGIRRLGLNVVQKKEGFPQGVAKILFEKDAALWFNQSPSGAVTVFMAPYGSDLLKMKEENIILGMYSSPEKLTDRLIRELLSTFFRYLSITSAHHQQSVGEYAWRLLLIYKDARTRKHEGFVKTIERLLLAAGAVACIWVIFATPSTAIPEPKAATVQVHQESSMQNYKEYQPSAPAGRMCQLSWLSLAVGKEAERASGNCTNAPDDACSPIAPKKFPAGSP